MDFPLPSQAFSLLEKTGAEVKLCAFGLKRRVPSGVSENKTNLRCESATCDGRKTSSE